MVPKGSCFLCAGCWGSLLYSWHVLLTTESDMERHDRFSRGLEKQNRTRPVHDPVETSTVDSDTVEVSIESDDTQTIAEKMEAFPGADVIQDVDFSEAFSDTAVVVADVPADEVSPYGVSPHGFGPFPEVPPDYFRTAEEVWGEGRLRTMSPGHELLSRVQIKLWTQGIRTFGAKFENGLVYPAYDDVVYIEWADSVAADGKMYVVRQFGSPSVINQYGDDIDKGIFPAHLKVYELPDGVLTPMSSSVCRGKECVRSKTISCEHQPLQAGIYFFGYLPIFFCVEENLTPMNIYEIHYKYTLF